MITEGQPIPPCVIWVRNRTGNTDGWNFALYSRHTTGVTLLLYGAKNFVKPVVEFRLDPFHNKTGRIWHCFVPRSAAPGARYYGYRVERPTGALHRFDPQKVLLDPFAEQVFFSHRTFRAPPAYCFHRWGCN